MTTISVRLSNDELAYLEAISKTKKIKSSTKKISPGRGLKQLIQWCTENQIDITSTYDKPRHTSNKLLEQLHVVMEV